MDPDQLYNVTFNKICKLMGSNDETYTSQLEKWGRLLLEDKFSGVYACDEVPDKFKYVIINLDKQNMPGSHWIGAAKLDGRIHVYDSFGRKSKKIIPDLFKGKGKKITDAEYDPEQNDSEDNCGQRSLSWLFIFDKFGKEIAMQI